MATDLETKYELIVTLTAFFSRSSFKFKVGLRYFYTNVYLLLSGFFLSFYDTGGIDFNFSTPKNPSPRVDSSGSFDAP